MISDQEHKVTLKSFLSDYFLAAISASITKTGVAPFEKARLIFENQHLFPNYIPEQKYKSTFDAMLKVSKKEGISYFWNGNIRNTIKYFPAQASNFAFYHTFKRILSPFTSSPDFWKFFLGNMISGGAVGATSLMVVYPIDLVRTRLFNDKANKTNARQFTGFKDCLTKIYKNEGIRGLYRGFSVSVDGAIIYRACYFGGYDTLKRVLFENGDKVNIVYKSAVAQFVTICAVLVAHPFDLVRRKLMMTTKDTNMVYNAKIECVKKIFREEGLQGFCKGIYHNIFRYLRPALTLVIYDELKSIFVDSRKVLKSEIL